MTVTISCYPGYLCVNEECGVQWPWGKGSCDLLETHRHVSRSVYVHEINHIPQSCDSTSLCYINELQWFDSEKETDDRVVAGGAKHATQEYEQTA